MLKENQPLGGKEEENSVFVKGLENNPSNPKEIKSIPKFPQKKLND